jgi:hypothetical protein
VDIVQFTPLLILVPAMVASLVLLRVNQHYASPALAIVNRWLRWLMLAGGSAQLCIHFGWSARPFAVLLVAFLIGWFFLESIYHWLAVHAMSVSPMPLFPRFTANRGGDEWPVQGRFLTLRDQIRATGFKTVQALRAEVASGLHIRASFYQDATGLTRLQVTFIPQPMGNVTVCLHLATQLADGRRIVTDNHYLPFAGFYPENWCLERRPWIRRLATLLERHRARVSGAAGTAVPWTTDPLADLNAQQGELEHLNTQLGFLLPSPEHEEHGRISVEGRYRVWKEILSLNYLGRPARYE